MNDSKLAAQMMTRAEYLQERATGERIYRAGYPIEQCENFAQHSGYLLALRAEADAETERYLAAHPQAVAA